MISSHKIHLLYEQKVSLSSRIIQGLIQWGGATEYLPHPPNPSLEKVKKFQALYEENNKPDICRFVLSNYRSHGHAHGIKNACVEGLYNRVYRNLVKLGQRMQ